MANIAGSQFSSKSSVSSGSGSTPDLTEVLTAGNDGGGLQIKDIAAGTDPDDAVTLEQLENQPGVVVFSDSSLGDTSGEDIMTYTNPDGLKAHVYRVGLIINSALGSGGTIGVTIEFDDENGNTQTLPCAFVADGNVAGLVNANTYAVMLPMDIWLEPAGTLTVTTSILGVGTTTYDWEGTVQYMQ